MDLITSDRVYEGWEMEAIDCHQTQYLQGFLDNEKDGDYKDYG